MKAKLTREQIEDIVKDPERAQAGITVKDPWWLIVLKVVTFASYAAGAGYLAVSCTRADLY